MKNFACSLFKFCLPFSLLLNIGCKSEGEATLKATPKKNGLEVTKQEGFENFIPDLRPDWAKSIETLFRWKYRSDWVRPIVYKRVMKLKKGDQKTVKYLLEPSSLHPSGKKYSTHNESNNKDMCRAPRGATVEIMKAPTFQKMKNKVKVSLSDAEILKYELSRTLPRALKPSDLNFFIECPYDPKIPVKLTDIRGFHFNSDNITIHYESFATIVKAKVISIPREHIGDKKYCQPGKVQTFHVGPSCGNIADIWPFFLKDTGKVKIIGSSSF